MTDTMLRRIGGAVMVAALATALSQYPNLKYGSVLVQERRLLDQFSFWGHHADL